MSKVISQKVINNPMTTPVQYQPTVSTPVKLSPEKKYKLSISNLNKQSKIEISNARKLLSTKRSELSKFEATYRKNDTGDYSDSERQRLQKKREEVSNLEVKVNKIIGKYEEKKAILTSKYNQAKS